MSDIKVILHNFNSADVTTWGGTGTTAISGNTVVVSYPKQLSVADNTIILEAGTPGLTTAGTGLVSIATNTVDDSVSVRILVNDGLVYSTNV